MLCATSSWSKNERFEFAVTEASLREVAARNEPGYTQWVDDVLDS